MLPRLALPLSALAAVGFASLPATAAQDGSHAAGGTATHHGSTHHGAARHGTHHGTAASPHVTPERQRFMERTGQHGHRTSARRGDAQQGETDRLNQLSLQQAQGGAPSAATPPAGAAAPR